MSRNLQDFLDEPPFGLIIAAALGLIITVFAFVGLRNLRGDDQVDASAAPTTLVTDSSETEPAAPTALIFTPQSSEGVICNGLTQAAGVVSGAEPGETLLFNGDSSIDLPAGFADSTGSYPLEWSCAANEINTTWRIQAVGQKSGGRVDIVFSGTEETNSSGFRATSVNDPFPCDGKVHPVAVLVGADPDEEITFSSPQSSSIRPGIADETGELQMNWSCDPDQAATTWSVTATATKTNQVVDVVFSGSTVAGSERVSTTSTSTSKPATTATTAITSSSTTSVESSSTTVSAAALSVQISEDPFGCDGSSRQFAKITNFAPLETVDFDVSPSDGPLRQGTADEDGQLLVRWQCDPAEADTEWNLTATGARSAKTVSFSFAGKAVESTTGGADSEGGSTGGSDSGSDSGAINDLSVSVIENPFVCDGDARPVVKLSRLGPEEEVTFVSSTGTRYRTGQADADGDLPVRWQCDEDEVQAWNITATGQTTGKEVEFSILGTAPADNG